LAISRGRKEELVARYTEILSKSDGLIVAEYVAMTVAETEQLRKQMRDAGAVYMVVKNNLFRLALREQGWPEAADLFKKPSGIVFSMGNLPGTAKAVMDSQKGIEEKFVVKGGIMGSSIFKAEDLEAVTKLPTLPEVQAQILGLLTQPASGLLGVLHAGLVGVPSVLQAADSQIVNVLQAYVQKLEQGDAA